MLMTPTYEQFKKANDDSKSSFEHLGRVSNVDFKKNTCTLTFMDNSTNMPISVLVTDIHLNGMGAISNPSALKGWSGFKRFKVK